MFAQALARTAQVYGDRMAIIEDAEGLSWHAFGERLSRVAAGLHAIGCEPGDRVAVLAGNSPEHLTIMYAVSWAGCVLVPLNTRLSSAEMERIIRESGCKAVACDGLNLAAVDALTESADQLPLLIGLDDQVGGEHPLGKLAERDGIDPWQAAMSDLAALYYTGGTTGRPKGVMISDGALTVQTLNLVNDLYVTPETVYIHAPPLFHLAGAGVAHACCFAGAAQVFPKDMSGANFIGTVADCRATLVSLIPTMLAGVMEEAGIKEKFKAVQTIVYGAAPISEALLRRVMERCPDVALVQIYGQTECTGPCLILPPERHTLSGPLAGKLDRAGRANATSEVRVVDVDGNPAAPGVSGEIIIRGPSVMQGYWQQPDLTAAALQNGWLHTGDVGIMDGDGFVQIVDRLKDMIVSGGENVFCAEVENVIAEHPDVKYCAVIGVPDKKWGERVHAVVGLEPDAELEIEKLREHCKQHIAGYKCPQSADFTSEPLPLSAVGKVRKDLLRQKHGS